MTSPSTEPRIYRFAPLDRSGWILGLGGAQCISLGAGTFVAGLLLQSTAPAPFVLAPVVVTAMFAFGSWDSRPVHEWAPVLFRHGAQRTLRRRRWYAPIPLLTGSAADRAKQPAFPPFLAGLELVDAGPVSWCAASR